MHGDISYQYAAKQWKPRCPDGPSHLHAPLWFSVPYHVNRNPDFEKIAEIHHLHSWGCGPRPLANSVVKTLLGAWTHKEFSDGNSDVSAARFHLCSSVFICVHLWLHFLPFWRRSTVSSEASKMEPRMHTDEHR